MPPDLGRLPVVLYRKLAKGLCGLRPTFGPTMADVAWGLFGPMFQPIVFGNRTIHQHLQHEFRVLPTGKTAVQRVQQALWALKHIDYVTHAVRGDKETTQATEAPARPLVSYYPDKREQQYTDGQFRTKSYPMLLDDLFARFPDQEEMSSESTHTTEGVEVTIQGVYIGPHESPGPTVHKFGYSVQIRNTSTSVVRLMSRHWFFYNPEDQVMDAEVAGNGAVGKNPVLGPQQSFSYESGTVTTATELVMKGTFQFIRSSENGDEPFDVYVAPICLSTQRL